MENALNIFANCLGIITLIAGGYCLSLIQPTIVVNVWKNLSLYLQILESLIKNLQDRKKKKPWYVWFISISIITLSFIIAITAPHHFFALSNDSKKETEKEKTIKAVFYIIIITALIVLMIMKS